MSTWTARPAEPAGHVVTASEMGAILDQIDVLSSRVVGGVRAESSSPYIGTTSGTTELNLANLAITGRTVTSGHMYRFAGALYVNASISGDSFGIRVREDTSLTGTIAMDRAKIVQTSGFDHDWPFVFYWKCTSSSSSKAFYVSVVRAAGTGTCSVYGNGSSTWAVEDMDLTASVWSIT